MLSASHNPMPDNGIKLFAGCVAFDGDADRCLAVSVDGAVVDGDAILAVCALALREQGRLKSDAVVITVMSNLGLHHAMRDAGVRLVTTPVGDRYVLAALREQDLSLGGEQSGHVVFADRATTGDGLLTALQLLGRVAGAVLLVESHGDMRAYLVRLLRSDGWRVTAVGDAASALRVPAPAPDLVLSAVMLPGTDGLELVRTLRRLPQTARLPVVLLTARAGPDAAAEGLAAGADDYIVKPFDPTELLARVRVHLELARLREYAISLAEDEAANLRRALSSNRQIGTAVGILMQRWKLGNEESFELLRVTSQRLNRKLRDLAEEMARTGVLPES